MFEAQVNRTNVRAGFDMEARMKLAEADLDAADARWKEAFDLIADMRKEVSAEVSGFKKVLVGMLITLCTASVMLAINILLGGLRGS